MQLVPHAKEKDKTLRLGMLVAEREKCVQHANIKWVPILYAVAAGLFNVATSDGGSLRSQTVA
jgi:hypothetical protein